MNRAAAMSWTRPSDQVDSMQPLNNMDELGDFFEFTDLDLNGLPNVASTHFQDANQIAGAHPSTPFEEMGEMQAMSATSAKDFATLQHQAFGAQDPNGNPYSAESLYQSAMQQQQHQQQQAYASSQAFQFATQPSYPSHQHVPPTPNSFEMHGETGRFLLQRPQSQHAQPLPPLDPQQRALLEQRYQLRKEDIAYTPMVSPAGTPSQYAVPDYTINPAAYFSPLTSPALHAQNTQQHFQHGYHNAGMGPTSNPPSPHDLNGDIDMMGDSIMLPETSSATTKKPRLKRANTPRTADPLARVRQSPIQKAAKRKSASMLSSFAVADPEGYKPPSRGPSSQPGSAGLVVPPQFRNDSSESGSISPEPLSEALMGPPPRRPASSVTNSPALQGHHHPQHQSPNTAAASAAAAAAAATPKSFLSMQRGQGSSTASGANTGDTFGGATMDEDFIDIQLPGAASNVDAPVSTATLTNGRRSIASSSAGRPVLPQLNTQASSASDSGDTPTATTASNTPRLSAARKTPKLGPSSTPLSSAARLTGSPLTASTPGALLRDRKSDASKPASRHSKKRSSVGSIAGSVVGGGSGSVNGGTSSVMVSPALRPKISPSIKPLLPEGSTLHSPTHALLLASKSNYQNLLEGNTLPGVNYPDSLSTGLTSKRTSHKVAEQGRRNRINEALREMQSLLPKTATSASKPNGESSPPPGSASKKNSISAAAAAASRDADDDDGKDDSGNAKSSSSKAATVESANDYIRQLQRENAQVALLRKQLEDVKTQLARMSTSSSGSSTVTSPEISMKRKGVATAGMVNGDDDDEHLEDADGDVRNGLTSSSLPAVHEVEEGVPMEI